MGNKTSIHVTRHPSLWEGLGGLLLLLFLLLFAVSCSETEDEEAGEFSNWQVRNEAYFASLEDSLSRGGSQWEKFKSYAKLSTTAGVSTDYVYVKKLEAGEGTESPMYTDSVRFAYRGRLMPSATYPEGYVFDQSYAGTFNPSTTGVMQSLASGLVEGFTTAILHMHKGDRWRVFIPYQLGYGTSASNSIPGYSTLIFDVYLVDFQDPKKAFPAWNARPL